MIPRDKIITTPPERFVPWQQWPEHNLAGDADYLMHGMELPMQPKGSRWGIWPLYCEGFTTDEEPDVTAAAKLFAPPPPRMVLWSRVFRTDIPAPWRRLSRKPALIIGFAYVPNSDDYKKSWSQTARRYARRWHEGLGTSYRVEIVSLEEFTAAYKRSTVYKRVGKDRLNDLVSQYTHSSPHVTLYAVRRLADGALVAGLAALTSPTCHGSYYVAGFITKDAVEEPHMIGLMDHWFAESQKSGITFLHLGIFWQKGNPRGWKGFSQFKTQFCTHFIEQPPTLWRLMPGKLWRF